MIHRQFHSVNEMEEFIKPYWNDIIHIQIDPKDGSFHIFVNYLFKQCKHCNKYTINSKNRCEYCGKPL